MIYNIAIVEDDLAQIDNLTKMIKSYKKEKGLELNVVSFLKPLTFLYGNQNFDIVFLDIGMPEISGMEIATELRKNDNIVQIVFVTNMVQYAVRGYSVDAIDFIVKPVEYLRFQQVMERVIKAVNINKHNPTTTLTFNGNLIRINIFEIIFIEVLDHKLIYHLKDQKFSTWGSLKEIEKEYSDYGFALCNNCYLVNLRYVTAVKGYTVTVGKELLQISHPKKKSFMLKLANYLGGG